MCLTLKVFKFYLLRNINQRRTGIVDVVMIQTPFVQQVCMRINGCIDMTCIYVYN